MSVSDKDEDVRLDDGGSSGSRSGSESIHECRQRQSDRNANLVKHVEYLRRGEPGAGGIRKYFWMVSFISYE